jgi:hypothetical protein
MQDDELGGIGAAASGSYAGGSMGLGGELRYPFGFRVSVTSREHLRQGRTFREGTPSYAAI